MTALSKFSWLNMGLCTFGWLSAGLLFGGGCGGESGDLALWLAQCWALASAAGTMRKLRSTYPSP